MSAHHSLVSRRVHWVDIAKGVCIVFVVMMHSTLGVEAVMGEPGFMGLVVAFAEPFRMPDFFLISGLFLALTIDRPWRLYLDRKVVHFAYFYVLWLTIQFAFKAPGIVIEQGAASAATQYLMAFVEPFGTLWFIYILPIFFVLTRWLKTLPRLWVFAWAAWLNVLPVATGWLLVDEFAARYVCFFAGYAAAPLIFRAADWAGRNRPAGAAVLAGWAVVNGLLVFVPVSGWLAGFGERPSELPFVGLALGFAGALAIVFAASLMAASRGALTSFFRLAGENSIVIYLAFFLPMAAMRTMLTEFTPWLGAGNISLVVTLVAVVSPLIMMWLIKLTGHGGFLIRRPRWAMVAQHPASPATAPAAPAATVTSVLASRMS